VLRGAARLLDAWRAEAATARRETARGEGGAGAARVAAAAAGRSPVQP